MRSVDPGFLSGAEGGFRGLLRVNLFPWSFGSGCMLFEAAGGGGEVEREMGRRLVEIGEW